MSLTIALRLTRPRERFLQRAFGDVLWPVKVLARSRGRGLAGKGSRYAKNENWSVF